MKQTHFALGETVTQALVSQPRIQTAKLSEFHSSRTQLLFGKALTSILQIENSILKNGLMRPLHVSRKDGAFIVIDGHKRLIALRRLNFKNKLPRSLVNVPYVIASEDAVHLMSAQDRYQQMRELKGKGQSVIQIAAQLCTDKTDIHALQSVDRLSPRLSQAFHARIITLAQAQAFASVGWHEAQDSLLLAVGPSASVEHILSKVTSTLKEDSRRALTSEPNSNVIQMPVPPLKGILPAPLSEYADFAA
jgi:hypothetical protein